MNDDKQIEMQGEIDSLTHQLRVSEAGSLVRLCSAYSAISKANIDRYTASGITLTVKTINRTNEVIVEEVLIADGLSSETIEAIKRDIERTASQKIDLAPSEFKELWRKQKDKGE